MIKTLLQTLSLGHNNTQQAQTHVVYKLNNSRLQDSATGQYLTPRELVELFLETPELKIINKRNGKDITRQSLRRAQFMPKSVGDYTQWKLEIRLQADLISEMKPQELAAYQASLA